MADYILTQKSVEDLAIIWNYTFDAWSENQADIYYRTLLDSFQLIADNPYIGKSYMEIQEDLFGLKVNRHIVFYRQSSYKPIEIIRILHVKMDLENRVKE
jgi:toxin ParE1/3/4